MEETGDLFTLDTKIIAHPSVAEMVASHYDNGKTWFNKFLKGLDTDECSLYQPIKKNKTHLFQQKPEPNAGDSKQKTLKDDCQSREHDLMDFFQHENQSFPAKLSDNGNHHICQKSQPAPILEKHVTPPDTEPESSFIILDGSALINALPSRISKTFEEYAVLEAVPKFQAYSYTYTRRYGVWRILVF